uniref:MFS domain-containing protein n=1 Tax=Panagrellus redivivus TaxID=6233 RepID=A0A7E4VPX9_PANRE
MATDSTPLANRGMPEELAGVITDVVPSCKRRNSTIWLFLLGCILTCITNFPSAYVHTATNTAVKSLEHYINSSYAARGLYDIEVTHITGIYYSSWYAGQVVGALFSPYITDVYGRKSAYIIATAVMTIACVFQTLATYTSYPELLIIGRVIASMFSPMSDAVLILYLQEVSPTELRGVMSSLMATGYAAMAVLGIVLGTEGVLGYSLTTLLFVPVIPGVLALIFLAYLEETPKFLAITKDQKDNAKRALRFYRGNISDDECEAIIDTYDNEKHTDNDKHASFSHVITKKHLRKALSLSFVLLLLTLPFYPILQASTAIYTSIHIPPSIAQISSTITMVALLIACLFAALCLKHFGRVTLIMGFGTLSFLSLAVFSFTAHYSQEFPSLKYAAFGGVVCYIICYGLAIGPISYFIATELVPLQYRSSMFCIVFSLNSVLVVAATYLTAIALKHCGALIFLPMFVFPSGMAVIYLGRHLPETKGREINSIVEELKGNKEEKKKNKKTKLEKINETQVEPEVPDV